MQLTCTNKNYKSQSLIVPILGTITLDDKCSFECPDDKADQFISVCSLPFVKPEEEKQDVKIKTAKAEPTKEDIEKAKKETEETVVNKEELIEAINDANIDELKALIPLVPKVKKKDIKNLNEDELRKFLIDKVNQASSN